MTIVFKHLGNVDSIQEQVDELEVKVDGLEQNQGVMVSRDILGNNFRTLQELMSATTFYNNGEVREVKSNDFCVVLADVSQADIVAGYSSFINKEQYLGYYILNNNESVLVATNNISTLPISPGTTVCYYAIPSSSYIYQSNAWKFSYLLSKDYSGVWVDNDNLKIIKN